MPRAASGPCPAGKRKREEGEKTPQQRENAQQPEPAATPTPRRASKKRRNNLPDHTLTHEDTKRLSRELLLKQKGLVELEPRMYFNRNGKRFKWKITYYVYAATAAFLIALEEDGRELIPAGDEPNNFLYQKIIIIIDLNDLDVEKSDIVEQLTTQLLHSIENQI